MKKNITLGKKRKKEMTRTQKILRNLIISVLLIVSLVTMRSGTFTEEQVYQNQLQALGITQESISCGDVRIISDTPSTDENTIHRYYGPFFEPVRIITLESTCGGELAHLRIIIGKLAFLWYGSDCEIYYPEYHDWKRAISYS